MGSCLLCNQKHWPIPCAARYEMWGTSSLSNKVVSSFSWHYGFTTANSNGWLVPYSGTYVIEFAGANMSTCYVQYNGSNIISSANAFARSTVRCEAGKYIKGIMNCGGSGPFTFALNATRVSN